MISLACLDSELKPVTYSVGTKMARALQLASKGRRLQM